MSAKPKWGTFPNRTEEEILLENQLESNRVLTGKEMMNKDPLIGARRIKMRLEDESLKSAGMAELYGAIQAIIECDADPKKAQMRKALEIQHVFKRLTPENGFALAIQAIRANDKKTFEMVVGCLKKQHPLHPEITRFFSSDGETLGHFAARCDHDGIIKAIQKIDPIGLNMENCAKENIAHTASRFCSWKTLDFLVEARPSLFAKKNPYGQTPLDMEGGPVIQTKLDLEKAQSAEKEGNNKKDDALRVLSQANQKEPVAPLVSVKNNKVKLRGKSKTPMEIN